MGRKPKVLSQPPQDNPPSDISSISELAYQAREDFFKPQLEKLEKLNIAYVQQVDNLLKELEVKNDEIRHLKQLLMGSGVPIIGEATRIIMSDEEVIAEKQLVRLRAASMERDLTLDEVKRFDLLVKNKRLAKGDATTIDGQAKTLPKETPVQELMLIASKKIKE